jgi:PKD repeat protein
MRAVARTSIRVLLCALCLALPAQASARGRLLGLAPPTGGAAAALSDGVRPLAAAASTGSVTYHGGPVLHSTRTFLIFWDPAGALGSDYEGLVARYLADVAADSGTQANVYSVATEYGDANGKVAYQSTFGGSIVDRTAYPLQTCSTSLLGLSTTPCLTDAAIQAEIAADLHAAGWTAGLDRVYFVLTPQGVVSCEDTTSDECSTSAFCGYHSQLDPAVFPAFPDADPVIYANLPYPTSGCMAPSSPNGSPADSTINVISHEHNEMITDPVVDQPAWVGTSAETEIADICRSSYGAPSGPAGAGFDQTINGDDYMLQGEYSNSAGACLQRIAADQPPVAEFTSASGDGQAFSFDAATSSDPDGHLVSYRWDFGDGAPAAAGAQTSHSFAGSGQRTVTLTVADNAGAAATVTHAITVGPPPPPAPPPPTPPATTPPPAAASPVPATPAAVADTTAPATTTPGIAAVAPAVAAAHAVAAPTPRLTATVVFGALGVQGIAGSFVVNRRSQAVVALLIARKAAVRMHITAQADGGPRSAQVILAQSMLGATGPGRVSWRVRLTRATLRALRRAPATVVTVRLTLRAAGEAPRVLSARRHLHA